MKNFVFINDELIEESQARISIFERGFMFGDAVFESCRVMNGELRFFNDHLKRLEYGISILKIRADIGKLDFLAKELIQKNNLKEGMLRISVSRGIGSEGYLPTKDCVPLIVMQTTIAPPALDCLINIGISSTICPISYGFKNSNSLPYVMAKIEAQENAWFDAIMLSNDGFICETSSANIFWIKEEKIYTPNQDCGIVKGIIRDKILKLSSFSVIEVKAQLTDLLCADEVFITNSRFIVLSVNKIELPIQFLQKYGLWGLREIALKSDLTAKAIKKALLRLV